MKRRWLLLMVVMGFLVLFSAVITRITDAGQSGYILETDGSEDVLRPDQLLIWEEPVEGTTATRVMGLPDSAFVAHALSQSIQPTHTSVWSRLWLSNTGTEAQSLLLEVAKPQLDNLMIFVLNNRGKVEGSWKLGRSLPFEERVIQHRNYLVPLRVSPGEQYQVLMRVETDSYITLPVRIWKDKAFWAHDARAQVPVYMFYGALGALLIYNLFLFISLRTRAYGFYVMYLSLFILLQLVWDGLAFQYLWPHASDWDRHANPVMLAGFACVFLLFVQHYLDVASRHFWLSVVSRGYSALLGVVALLSCFTDPVRTVRVVVMILGAAIVLILCVLVMTWRKSREYYYFMAGCGCMLLGASINMMAAWGWLPGGWVSFNAPRIGALFEAMVLSFGLADTIHRARRERELEVRQNLLMVKLQDATRRITGVHEPLRLVQEVRLAAQEILQTRVAALLLRQREGYVCFRKGEVLQISAEELWELSVLVSARNSAAPVALDAEASQFFGCPEVAQAVVVSVGQGNANEGFLIIEDIQTAHDRPRVMLLDQIAVAVRNVRMMEQIRHMAEMDALTGALTRRSFIDRAEGLLEEAEAAGTPLGLLMIDLDNFKSINDTFGHDAGDRIICTVAACIRENLREGDWLGRFGGDEFMVVLPQAGSELSRDIAERLRRAVAQKTDGEVVRVTLSIGISVCGQGCSDFASLFKTADEALYYVKSHGRNGVAVSAGA